MRTLKKNQIVIYVMALMLVTAGYLNYYANQKQDLMASSEIKQDDNNIGDATFVSSNEVTETNSTDAITITENTSSNVENTSAENVASQSNNNKSKDDDNYFTNSKLERDKMYSQMLETYQNILKNTTISEEQKSIATNEINSINSTKNAIMICENLLSIKGFDKNVVLVNSESVNIVVKAEKDLTKEQIAQIQNIVSRELNTKIENIHITEKNEG